MSEFVFLFRSSEADRSAAVGTPEQAQKTLERWLAWVRGLEQSGNLVDYGRPLDTGSTVLRGKTVTDGPYAEKDLLLGFNVVEARDMAHAVELASACPILEGGGTVEVRPVNTMIPRP